MSPAEIQVRAQKEESVFVTVSKPPPVQINTMNVPGVLVVAAGNVGPPGPKGDTGTPGPEGPEGPQGQWISMTQSEYDALDPPDSKTLYVIVE